MKERIKYYLERIRPIGALARLHRTRRLAAKYRRWCRSGGSGPMPDYGKQKTVLNYIERIKAEVFVETGTYRGRMTYAVLPHVSRVCSIELADAHYRRAKERFAGYRHVEILHGDSGRILPELLRTITGPCVFWLDAHFSGGSTARGELQTPIMREVRYILEHPSAESFVLLIDDARSFTGENDYPAMETLRGFVLEKRPGWVLEVKDDIIRIHSAGVEK